MTFLSRQQTQLLNHTLHLDMATPISDLHIESEKNDYKACTFTLGNNKIIFRQAKITPKKIGLFTAIWKRDTDKTTTPYHIHDSFDYLVIGTNMGYFIYPKSALVILQIISTEQKEGKRGMRVYPTYEPTMNKQALKTYQLHQPFWHIF